MKVLLSLMFLSLLQVSEGATAGKCKTCQQELQALKKGILDRIDEDSLYSLMSRICEGLPKQECLLLGKQALLFWNELKHVDTEQICIAVGECGNDLDINIMSRNGSAVIDLEAGQLCSICKMIMSYIHRFLSDKSIQNAILSGLKSICGFLGPFRKTCLSLVDKYGPLLISLAEQTLTPELCSIIGLCGKGGENTLKISDDPFTLYFPSNRQKR